MSSIGNLPPPFPNAAQSLSKVAGDAQLRARIERSAEQAPIKTSFPSEESKPGVEINGGDQAGGGNGSAAKSAVDLTV